MTLPIYTFILVSASIVDLVSATTCYFPNGNVSPNDIPCSNTAGVSVCCAGTAKCLSNGLCFGSGLLSRGSCTDKNWGSDCPLFCRNLNPAGGSGLLPCSDNPISFTCGSNQATCQGNNFTIPEYDIALRAKERQALIGNNAAIATSTSISIRTRTSTVLASSSTTSAGSNLANNDQAAAAAAPQTTSITSTSSELSQDCAQNSTRHHWHNGGYFTASDMAAVGLSIGLPLLTALLFAIYLIRREKQQVRMLNATHRASGYASRHSSRHASMAAVDIKFEEHRTERPVSVVSFELPSEKSPKVAASWELEAK